MPDRTVYQLRLDEDHALVVASLLEQAFHMALPQPDSLCRVNACVIRSAALLQQLHYDNRLVPLMQVLQKLSQEVDLESVTAVEED